jgi:outer membrane protein OmpA-like peptidoglycan-associated protein
MVEGQARLAFADSSADIDAAGKSALDELAQRLLADETLRLEILAYASGSEDAANRARRMSLSRALAVRSYLIKQGVQSTRMDVRALGNNVEGEPADRVDLIPKAS